MHAAERSDGDINRVGNPLQHHPSFDVVVASSVHLRSVERIALNQRVLDDHVHLLHEVVKLGELDAHGLTLLVLGSVVGECHVH